MGKDLKGWGKLDPEYKRAYDEISSLYNEFKNSKEKLILEKIDNGKIGYVLKRNKEENQGCYLYSKRAWNHPKVRPVLQKLVFEVFKDNLSIVSKLRHQLEQKNFTKTHTSFYMEYCRLTKNMTLQEESEFRRRILGECNITVNTLAKWTQHLTTPSSKYRKILKDVFGMNINW